MRLVNKTKAILAGVFILTAYGVLVSSMTNLSWWIMVADVISGLSVIGIAAIMYPFFKVLDGKISLGYLLLKIFEGGLMVVGGILFLSDSFQFLRNWIYDGIHLYIFISSGFIFYYLLYKTELVPKFVSVWGGVAIFVLFLKTLLEFLNQSSPVMDMLLVLIITNEIFLAFWLIIKGFKNLPKMKKMKAIICTKYGPPEVLRLVEVKKPIPKEDEVLIRVRATTVHIGDTKIRRFEPGMGLVKDFIVKLIMRFLIGFTGPRKKILGMELAGEIEAVGKKVTRFKKGDKIFASTEMNFGGYAEYACLPEKGVMAIKPINMTYEEAAPAVNGGVVAQLVLRKAKIQKGQKVMIYGASGSLGTYAVQLAKHLGAEVTGVCSGANLKMVTSIGADKVMDYTTTDFTENNEKYDVIFDTVGKMNKLLIKKMLKKTGIYLNILTAADSVVLKAADLISIKELGLMKVLGCFSGQYLVN